MIILFILWKTVYVELLAIVIYPANPHTISEHNKNQIDRNRIFILHFWFARQ